jgi:hypothetical protein
VEWYGPKRAGESWETMNSEQASHSTTQPIPDSRFPIPDTNLSFTTRAFARKPLPLLPPPGGYASVIS